MLSGLFGIVVLAIKTTQIEFVSTTLANDYSLQQWHLGTFVWGFGVGAQRYLQSCGTHLAINKHVKCSCFMIASRVRSTTHSLNPMFTHMGAPE